ncbi:MAG: type II secretion system protein E [Candidatus Syntrophoarchaeum butanivorans]|uniref:Type II secretion system protein E n=1 Tax=Candidatus Syntropharchaeum butanivorans TaxID=1839936 RepID=A0A1F2P2S1_9EURY|nr:MAG: type II secretion system protein E [Candidatus Syntrophoarchaeum butanivorans]
MVYRLNGGSYAHIWYEEGEKRLRYDVIEPELDERFKKILDSLKRLMFLVLDAKPPEVEDVSSYLQERFEYILSQYEVDLTYYEKRRLIYYLIRDMAYYERITPLLDDPHIEDISCNGLGIPIYVYHRLFGSMRTNILFEDEKELDSLTIRIAQRCGRHISISMPLLDAALPEGSRVSLTLSKEVTMRGSTTSIRKFRIEPITPPMLTAIGSISPQMLAYLWILIENKSSILVAGEVATGKTTLLNAFSLFIPPDMKIISIEDTPEIQLPHENWIPAITRSGFGASIISGISGISGLGMRRRGEITMLDLLKSSLRQRPDYVILGEVRGEEATVLFQAIATGHLALTTMHGSSPRAIIQRLESPPMNIPPVMIDSLNCICMQARIKYQDKMVRRTTLITEVVGYDFERDEVRINDLFRWNPSDDSFEFSGKSHLLERIAYYAGLEPEDVYAELERRARVIEWLADSGITETFELSRIVAEYYHNPDDVLARMEE